MNEVLDAAVSLKLEIKSEITSKPDHLTKTWSLFLCYRYFKDPMSLVACNPCELAVRLKFILSKYI